MSVFKKIFGTKEIVDNSFKAIDKVFFTNEEKSENWINTLKAYEPFKISQRLIALIVCAVYVGMWVLSGVLLVLSIWVSGLQDISIEIAQKNKETLNTPFSIIIGFYFMGGATEGIISKFRKK